MSPKKKPIRALPVCRHLTCLWVNLRGEVRGRGARGEVVPAVGDEGRQRVHMMRVLNNRDFIRLKDREERLGPAACELGVSQLLFPK